MFWDRMNLVRVETKFTLKNDDSLWHRSWTKEPNSAASQDALLKITHSYGFSFVGFSSEVIGKLSMDEFEIRAKT